MLSLKNYKQRGSCLQLEQLMHFGAINVFVGWVSFALTKLESQTKIKIQNLLDYDFYSRIVNLQNAFFLECILYLSKYQPNI
jgi:hypothetical protein